MVGWPRQKVANISWDRENYIFPKVSNMGSIIGHRTDYNGIVVLRSQRTYPAKINPSNLLELRIICETNIVNKDSLISFFLRLRQDYTKYRRG